jgi:hypothetical protein
MEKVKLIEMAKVDSLPDGYLITGYCTVNNDDPQVTCTRDKAYQDNSGQITDCIFAENTTKAKCEHWHRIKSFKFRESLK